MKKQRLDKFISNQFIMPRTHSKTAIRCGKVSVNGSVIKDPAYLFDAENSEVIYNGKVVSYKEHIYLILNKPAGILSAATDKSKQTVVDLVPRDFKRNGLFPVGRLDKDTTGLLIITDDGDFAHNCISPKKQVEKSYIATLDGNINEEIVNIFNDGVVLADGTKCKSAKLEPVENNTVRIIISEGKYHQIKRMFGTVSLGVNKLHRERIGELVLPSDLKVGEFRELSIEEAKKALISTNVDM